MNLIRRGEYHAFAGGDAHFLYLVPSAAVVRIDDVTQAVLDCLETGDRSPGDLTTSLGDRWTPEDVRSSIDELLGLFGGRTQPVMAHLVESGKLTIEEVQETEKLLRSLAKKKEDPQ